MSAMLTTWYATKSSQKHFSMLSSKIPSTKASSIPVKLADVSCCARMSILKGPQYLNMSCCVAKVVSMNLPILSLKIMSAEKSKKGKAKILLLGHYAIIPPEVFSEVKMCRIYFLAWALPFTLLGELSLIPQILESAMT